MINKLWRERIQDARERGWFNISDIDAICGPNTCMAGEVAHHYGMGYLRAVTEHKGWDILWKLGDEACAAISQNQFDQADYFLTLIEDTALKLKREQAA